MVLDSFVLNHYEKSLEKKINVLVSKIEYESIDKITNLKELKSFIIYFENVITYISLLNLLVKVKKEKNQGVSSKYNKRILLYLYKIEAFLYMFVSKDFSQIVPDRQKSLLFIDEISELEKVRIFKKMMITLSVFEINIDDTRLSPTIFNQKTILLGAFKNWFNFKNIFDILDSPEREDYIEMTEFLERFFLHVNEITIACYDIYELGLKTNTQIYKMAVDLLSFLLKVENIYSGRFFDNIEEMKKRFEFWKKTSENYQ